MKKCKAANPYLGLLNLGRTTNSQIPMLQTKNWEAQSYKNSKELRKCVTAQRINEYRRDLKPLNVRDHVRLQPVQSGKRNWEPAEVSKQLNKRSYEVTTSEGRKFIRNRQFLRLSAADVPNKPQQQPEVANSSMNDQQTVH